MVKLIFFIFLMFMLLLGLCCCLVVSGIARSFWMASSFADVALCFCAADPLSCYVELLTHPSSFRLSDYPLCCYFLSNILFDLLIFIGS